MTNENLYTIALGGALTIIGYFAKKKLDKLDDLSAKVEKAIENSVSSKLFERYIDEQREQRKEDQHRHERDHTIIVEQLQKLN